MLNFAAVALWRADASANDSARKEDLGPYRQIRHKDKTHVQSPLLSVQFVRDDHPMKRRGGVQPHLR